MSDLQPLFSQEAEDSVLGSVLINPEAVNFIDLAEDEFYIQRNGFVWAACQTLKHNNGVIDFVTVADQLKRDGKLDEIGGEPYLMKLITNTTSSLHGERYAEIVRDYHQRRKLVANATELAKAAYDFERGIDDIIADQTSSLTSVSTSSGDGSLSYRELLSRHFDRMSQEQAPSAIMTGFKQFDNITGGIYPSEFILFYGKPKVKKTQFIHQMAEQIARGGVPVAVFQTETPEETIMNREVSRLSLEIPGDHITTRQLESHNLEEKQWPVYTHVIEKNEILPLYINFDQQTTASIEAESARLKVKHGIRIVFIDYLRLLGDAIGKMDEWQRQEMIARRLKIFSRRSGLAVVAIHNLLKEGIESARPKTEDGSGGAGIPYDCDKSIFITEHIPQNGGEQQPNVRTFIIDLSRRAIKQRVFNMVVNPDYPCYKDPVFGEC